MKAPSPAALLRAGALVAENEKKALGGAAYDRTLAAAYRHPALGDRPVVRLGAEPLAEGDALVMTILGFGEGEARGAVGLSRRRALGFPGWALVHHPKEARYALDVLGELRKEARRAKTKPGHAKKGFDAIADRLGKSVPAFLPSYWEEAGRAFLEVGSLKYASQCFERARDAERVHALETDEAHRQASFLEFALAGAVSNKSLGAYAKELAKARTPLEAHAAFHELCVKRTLGGMPPFTGMAKQLARLAKAAKLDPKEQAARLVSEVIESPSLGRAAPDFWSSYDKTIVALAKKSPAVRGVLLRLFPAPSSGGGDFDEWWLGFLDRCGALEALVTTEPDGIDAAARPSGTAAAWLERFVTHTQRSWRSKGVPAGLFALLGRAAPRLKADAHPLWLANRWGIADLDLTDLALELGVPVTRKVIQPVGSYWARQAFDLARWAAAAERPEHGRDPVHVAADPTLGPLLVTAFEQHVGREPFDTVAVGKRGLAEAKRRWLEGCLAKLTGEALPSVKATIERLEAATRVSTFAEVPGSHATLAAARVAPALARTLANGVFAELGWPALDEVWADFEGPRTVHGAFPFLVVSDGVRAVGVPVGELPRVEAEVRLPKGAKLVTIRRVGDRLLFLYTERHRGRARWSDQEEAFEHHAIYGLDQRAAVGVAVGGGVSEGGVAMRPGDASVELPNTGLVSDGATHWVRAHQATGPALVELDPATGARGRRSLPAFFEAEDSTAAPLDVFRSSLLPVPDADAPTVGSADGLVGVRVRTRPDGALEACAPDGRTWTGAMSTPGALALLVRFPGSDETLPVVSHSRRHGAAGAILSADGRFETSSIAEFGPYVKPGPFLPVQWWGALRPRDEAASKALRGVDESAAERLLEAARADRALPDRKAQKALANTRAAVRALLPDGADSRVAEGVCFVVAHAARLEAQLATLGRERDPEGEGAKEAAPPIPEAELRQALGTLFRERYWGRGDVGVTMRDAARFFAREPRGDVSPQESGGAFPFEGLLGQLGAVATLAASPYRSDAERRVLLAYLSLAGEVLDAPGELRRYTARSEVVLEGPANTFLFSAGGRDYLIRRRGVDGDQQLYAVLEHAPPGIDFAPPPGTTSDHAREIKNAWRPGLFLEALAARGPIPFDPAAAGAIVEATGMSRAEAGLLLTGLPNFSNYQANFLDKETRATLGIKASEAKIARATIQRAPLGLVLAALGVLHVGDRPEAAWTPSEGGQASPAVRLAQVWRAVRGQRTPLDPALLAAATATLKRSWTPAATVLPMLAAPDEAKALTTDGPWLYDEKNPHRNRHGETPTHFTGLTAHAVATFVPFLFDALPVGDALRAKLPRAVELARERLASDDLLLGVGSLTFYGDEDPTQKVAAYLDALSGQDIVREGAVVGRDAGLIVAGSSPHAITLHCRPARVKTDADLERIETLAAASSGWRRPYKALRAIRQLDAFLARIAETPVPDGGFEANPLASAPELVKKVAAARGLDEDSAALYLMLLTLADARTKRLREITGWTAARLKKAAAPLVENELVLEAKRARAGRAWFLPGGWEALKAPDLPIETWKLPLYEATRDAEGRLVLPLEHLLPPAPWHVLFERAWDRVEAGDAPRYEETR